jgi:phosphatidylethanolamine-binding protein (PEBP) family uncharacterized protein
MMDNKFAFCVPAAQGHTTGGANLSPSISWSKGPRGTKSYAIILYDTDSPAELTVYALSVPSLDLPKGFDGPAAMKGKILAQGEELGLFTQNPAEGAKVLP